MLDYRMHPARPDDRPSPERRSPMRECARAHYEKTGVEL